MLAYHNKKYVLATFIWVVFVFFRYFGDYPAFILPLFEWLLEIDFIKPPLTKLSDSFSFNQPDAAWLTARFIVSFSLLINFVLIRLIFNKTGALVFLCVAILAQVISAIGSPLGWTELRFQMNLVIELLSQPVLLLILIPAYRVYRYLG